MKGFTTLVASLVALVALAAGPLFAQTAPPPAQVFGASVGVNGVWTRAAEIRDVSDVEAGLHLRASLSPHISLVGSGGYAFINEYGFAQAGPRITISDVKDRALSVGVGIQYRWISDELYGLKEWRPDVVIGWRPPGFPDRVILGAGASYGLTSEEPQAILAARYVIY